MSSQWASPRPPRQPGEIRSPRVWLGIGLAAVGHALTIGVILAAVAANRGQEMAALNGLVAGFVAQAVLFLVCLVAGILLIVRGDRGLGIGVVIGWAVGLLVAPVVGSGVCVWATGGFA